MSARLTRRAAFTASAAAALAAPPAASAAFPAGSAIAGPALPAALAARLAQPETGACACMTDVKRDAELITLCDQHIVNLATYNRDGGRLEYEVCPLWQAYAATLDAVADAEPQTMAGILALCRVAVAEAGGYGNGEDRWEGAAGDLAGNIVNALLRLAPAGRTQTP